MPVDQVYLSRRKVWMNTLLGQVLATHSGLERWRQYNKVEATIVTGGGFFPPKGVLQDRNPRRMTAWLHEKRSFVTPYGAPDQRTMLTPDRIAIEKLDVTVVDERYAPRESFAGHQMHTRWDPLHCAYFSGDAVWTYLTTPFLLAMDGVRVEEIEAWREETETWRVAPRHVPRLDGNPLHNLRLLRRGHAAAGS
jgi:hypothetical protein